MHRLPYRVLPSASLSLYPRGTKVGDVVSLTDAEALYERDMGRLGSPEDPWPPVVEADPVPGETKGHQADAVTGEAIDLSAEERARIEAGPDLGQGEGEAALGVGQASGDLPPAPAKGKAR